ncbi:MAG: protein O-GlcNAcase [Gaiellaceae bacterium]
MIRGVIEGFYGPPWTHEERLDLIAFCGAERFNTWVHAPKDDPYHRARWREPYPEAELAQIAELAAACIDNGLEFAYAIAPGLDVDYGDERELGSLAAKCDQLRAIGVSAFQLLWDDLEPTPAGEAQARFSNRFRAGYLHGAPLVVCPTGYAGVGRTPYRDAFGAALDEGTIVYWTGREVVPDSIARDELDGAVQAFGHELLIWDNYPVNDFAPQRLFLGPLRGRDPTLFDGRCAGLVANAMLQAVPSKLPLATVADYLRDPHGYDPDAAFARARDAYGAEVAAALRTLPAVDSSEWLPLLEP